MNNALKECKLGSYAEIRENITLLNHYPKLEISHVHMTTGLEGLVLTYSIVDKLSKH